MAIALAVKQVNFSYRKSGSILSDVSLEVEKGSFSIFIGPNGGGKSTLLNLIMGFLEPQSGSIVRYFTKIGYVAQSQRVDLDFPITLLDLVLMGCLDSLTWTGHYKKGSKEKAYSLIEKMGLKGFETFALKELSGGQLQRAHIAMALATDPDLLILDEPTSNVDKEAKKIILSLLSELKMKSTILMVTHDFDALLPAVDRIFFVNNGLRELTKESMCQHTQFGLYHQEKA